MSKLDKDQVIAKFTEAYKAANGKEPQIEAKSGWYSVDGGKNVRLATLDEMADELAAGKSTTASKPAAKADKPAKPAAKAKSAPAKKPAKKKAPAKGGFSVKAFWGEQLTEGSRLPR
ncbi:hypothetical protein HMF8227_01359 [Saliniradius amylolyticus]|uniref:Uncharacterized protein n=1 Tax=Saliniradius amylolyticus TaxID=2183582 RepID=A0A2S2E4A1_9ALTE|nr:hypothetical protein [Saliniradius amylolyticus]AWL11837.1 hypothetical protein HMF8227_01359 [Saliniradius amylolyticus]